MSKAEVKVMISKFVKILTQIALASVFLVGAVACTSEQGEREGTVERKGREQEGAVEREGAAEREGGEQEGAVEREGAAEREGTVERKGAVEREEGEEGESKVERD
ncbi:hypothetical protein H6F86_14135 [Phormidium sp. FACHB-592]|uniref:Uncharacterized protein n=1 Tax=Stenomitos frigidus AS-A4 TaxID=2933935 RepID=A0ABV0KQQ7_9CYAN|nr:hypothetical protein [Phormidium sp. FACHB-592]MBD2075012.1 hypothetical protein [Phormidium sp. FACHB-592]